MEAMRTDQNSLGLLGAPSEKLWGNANSRMEMSATPAQDVYEIRPRKDRDGFDLISDRLRRGPIWYAGPDAPRLAISYARPRACQFASCPKNETVRSQIRSNYCA